MIAIAEALLKYETLQGEEIKHLMHGERLGKPTVSELLEAAAQAGKTKTAAPDSNRPLPGGGPEQDFGKGVTPSPAWCPVPDAHCLSCGQEQDFGKGVMPSPA